MSSVVSLCCLRFVSSSRVAGVGGWLVGVCGSLVSIYIIILSCLLHDKCVLFGALVTHHHNRPSSIVVGFHRPSSTMKFGAGLAAGAWFGSQAPKTNCQHGPSCAHTVYANLARCIIPPPYISWNFRGGTPKHFLKLFQFQPPLSVYLSYFSFFRTFSYIMERIVPCMHTFIHTYIHACIHTCIHAYIHACMHACIHTYINHY